MRAAEILGKIRELDVLIAGDVCLDRWCRYDPGLAEPSRETGIPRTAVVSTEVTPGAAGTVANNLVALEARTVSVLGTIGQDGFGFELKRALTAGRIAVDLVVESDRLPTYTYTKLINRDTGIEDLPRVDFVNVQPVPKEIEAELCSRLTTHWDRFSVVLVSDQAETESGGMITAAVRDTIAALALRTPEKVVWVDSRKRGELFRGVLLKCNEDEAAGACARAGGLTLEALRRRIGAKPMIVTEGERGARVISESGEQVVPCRRVTPVDICGAGDSFSAGCALALAITGDPARAAWFGNLVSSVTIQKKGTGTASPEELIEAERGWAG